MLKGYVTTLKLYIHSNMTTNVKDNYFGFYNFECLKFANIEL